MENTKKRIMFIIGALGGGGAEKVIIDILQRFDQSVYDITLLVIVNSGIYDNSIPKGVNIHYIFDKYNFGAKIKNKLFTKFHFWKLINIGRNRNVLSSNYDAIISFIHGEPILIHSFLLNKTKNNITWVHGDFINGGLSRYNIELIDRIYPLMNKIVFVSKGAQDAYNKKFKISDYGNQIVIYNLVDKNVICERANDLHVVKKKFTVITVSRLSPVKGVDNIIAVAEKFKKAGLPIDFNIVGVGQCEHDLKAEVFEKRLEEYVHFLGWKNNPYPYVCSSDLYLCPSRSEAFSISVAEALCLGIPVVATRVSGVSELLADDHGILVEQNTDAIYNAILDLYNHRDKLHYYHERSLERASIFDANKTMNEIYSLFK